MPALVGYVRCNQEISWKIKLKLNSSKEVIAFGPNVFPTVSVRKVSVSLKIGIFQDLVDRVAGEMNLSKTVPRSLYVLHFELALPLRC